MMVDSSEMTGVGEDEARADLISSETAIEKHLRDNRRHAFWIIERFTVESIK